MFTIETIVPALYADTYDMYSWQTGLSFLGAGVGNILGSLASGQLSDYLLRRARQKRNGLACVEDRLTFNVWPSGFIVIPLGVLLFGYSIHARFTVWIPIIGFGIVCFGTSQVYAAGSAYLVDAVTGKSASVTAASNLLRMVMACALSLTAHPILENVGPAILAIIIAGINIVGMLLFLYVKFQGPKLRREAAYEEDHM
ncbi:hypothetical protein DFQ30_009352 [Apophysomyces sp. BC1015]|nr:hypothetical protein DFQ30_009352 [Apophysomyces sp. BC1015]KAG0172474.1 hypothetical protein DFQ29_008354 [Apophysomyces sp. BC1021]